MRICLALLACALAVPAFAGVPSPETALPDQAEIIPDRAERAASVGHVLADLGAQAADAAAPKEHNNQVDEPGGPPCGAGG
jgi:hypothetical protein